MKNIIYRISLILSVIFFTIMFQSCDKATLSERAAIDAVEDYLETSPMQETSAFEIGTVRLKAKKDAKLLNNYKQLQANEYIDMELIQQKKKILAKDSVYTYIVKLTDKIKPFVVKHSKNTIEVKAFEYKPDEKEAPRLELTGKTTAKVVSILKKTSTDFAALTVDKNPNTPFITKTFKLKYRKDTGWKVISVNK